MSSPLRYGSWPSPLESAAVSSSSTRIDGARFVGDDVWWGQPLPSEGGRIGVKRQATDGATADVLPAPWNASSGVHEYGGGSWTATDEGILLFVEKTDQRVWALHPGEQPRALTPEHGGMRFGGLSVQHGVVLAVRETHLDGITRDIVHIPLSGAAATDPTALVVLASGSDFLAHPALSPDRTKLAWIAWNHPHMPWDHTELRVTRVDVPGSDVHTIAGGESAPLQPEWLSEDELLYADDLSGRWNIWRARLGESPQLHSAADADTGGAVWVLGTRWFRAFEDGTVLAVRTHGVDQLELVDREGQGEPVDAPPTAGLCVEDVRGNVALVSGQTRDAVAGLWMISSAGRVQQVAGGSSPWAPGWIPRARAVTVAGPNGPVHSFAYPPTHPDLRGEDGELAPYVVLVHGGPTSHVGGVASGKIAYLTSRGIGVLEVNYGGSTGYGRAYRERLRGQWGVVDVEDVAAAAQGLVDEGLADPARIAISGGSAGGWTVLAALVNTDVFAAGISRYGVGDARTLAEDTHDFEARYLDSLIGPLPEAESVYVQRSPLSHPDGFQVPVLLLQGSADKVVPPSQSEAIRDALTARGIPHAYVLYEGEGHGFRRAETIVHALETELAFLGAVFGFTPPGNLPIDLAR